MATDITGQNPKVQFRTASGAGRPYTNPSNVIAAQRFRKIEVPRAPLAFTSRSAFGPLPTMLTSFFLELTSQCDEHLERREGVAFLKALQSLYDVADLSYLCLNLPRATSPGTYLHCHYSGAAAVQKLSAGPVETARLAQLGLLDMTAVDWRDSERLAIELDLRSAAVKTAGPIQGASFRLNATRGEIAVFGFVLRCGPHAWNTRKAMLIQDLQILARYFHSHILRLNGHDARAQMMVSARELECLKWTAEGKTAQEASEILGISERTVRFHLNAAREKMKCITTTQAVAQAIARNLIKISNV
jgi:DNA-binding CsgD family transcriptional regulator